MTASSRTPDRLAHPAPGVVASGLTPLIAAWLVTRGGGSLWLVSAYAAAVAVAVLSLVCARLLPETAGRDLDEPWHPTPDRRLVVSAAE